MNIERLQELAGYKSLTEENVKRLVEARNLISEKFDESIQSMKNRNEIDEGLWSALEIGFNTLANLGKAGVKKARDSAGAISLKAKMISEPIRREYQKAKVQAELKYLIKQLATITDVANNMFNQTKTLIMADPEIKGLSVEYNELIGKFLALLSTRIAVTEGIENDVAAIQRMLVEFHANPVTVVEHYEDLPVHA